MPGGMIPDDYQDVQDLVNQRPPTVNRHTLRKIFWCIVIAIVFALLYRFYEG